METVELYVAGRPITQGSKTAMRRGAHTVVVDRSNIKTKTLPPHRLDKWRESVAQAARAVMGDREPWQGPVSLMLEFQLPRPRSHFLKSGLLTKRAPAHHLVKPDKGKLARAVEDALTGVVYVDDSQIVAGATYKMYCNANELPGVRIRAAAV